MARYWTASYWTQSSESVTDARLPTRHAVVMGGAISRLLLVEGALLVAGRDGLVRVGLSSLCVESSLPASPSQRCINALCADLTLDAALAGAEDGSIVSVNMRTLESTPFFEPGEGQAAVLDLVAGSSTVFAACAKGFVWAIDRETKAPVWRINMRTASTGLEDFNTGLRATVVRLDPSGKWLLCGAGSSAASGEGGFLSIWHSETREVVSVMPTRGCPSATAWMRGSILCCGGENVLYQFDFNGKLMATSAIDLTEAWDVACFTHPDDLVGGAIAVGGTGGNHVLILPAVGRKAWALKLEK
jgi:hypothetical protein